MSRNRKTTAAKILTGSLNKSRIARNEPQPAPGVPPMPETLSALGRAYWGTLSADLLEQGVLSESDGPALMMLCESLAELETARASLASHGGSLTYAVTTKAGGLMWRQYPEIKMISDADRRVASWLARFGLTPADRSRVEAGPQHEADSPWSQIRKNGIAAVAARPAMPFTISAVGSVDPA